MQTLSDEQIEALDKQYDGVAAVHTGAGTAVFRAPSEAEYERFLSMLIGDDPSAKAKAARWLTQAIVVSPPREEFAAWCKKRTAIPIGCLKPIQELAGAEVEVHEKKSLG